MPRQSKVTGVRRELKRTRELFEQEQGEHMLRTGIEVLNSVVSSSPVDTGRFRGNWVMTQKRSDEIPHPEPPYPTTAQIPALDADQVRVTFWISNNLPYAGPLEEGHSGQAPQGVVQPTLDRLGLKGSFEVEA